MAKSKPTRIHFEIPDDYLDKFLDCRVDRHAWYRMQVLDPGMNVPFGYGVYRQCSKCGSIWIRSYNRQMTAKIYERRIYAPGYLLKGVGYADTRPKQIQYLRLLIEREDTNYIDPDKGQTK